jgi:hypothetical protein
VGPGRHSKIILRNDLVIRRIGVTPYFYIKDNFIVT